MKIAIFSSAFHTPSKENILLAENMGKYLAEKNISVLTGGCIGLPAIVADAAYKKDTETIAYFPDVSQKELIKNKTIHNNDLSGVYTEKKYYEGFTKRSIEMIKDADAAIVFNGRLGTLSEFTIATEENVMVGVVEDTGGISDKIKEICTLVDRDIEKDNIFIGSNYKKIIDILIKKYKEKKKKENV